MQATPVTNRVDDILVRDDRPCEDVLDEVYRKYHDTNPFMPVTHFVDHSTMGAEALVALGIGDTATRWIARHRAPTKRPSAASPFLRPGERRSVARTATATG